jgi:hypothetical protein
LIKVEWFPKFHVLCHQVLRTQMVLQRLLVLERKVCWFSPLTEAWQGQGKTSSGLDKGWVISKIQERFRVSSRNQWKPGEILTGAINHSRGVLHRSYKKSLQWGVPQELFCMAKIKYFRATGVIFPRLALTYMEFEGIWGALFCNWKWIKWLRLFFFKLKNARLTTPIKLFPDLHWDWETFLKKMGLQEALIDWNISRFPNKW